MENSLTAVFSELLQTLEKMTQPADWSLKDGEKREHFKTIQFDLKSSEESEAQYLLRGFYQRYLYKEECDAFWSEPQTTKPTEESIKETNPDGDDCDEDKVTASPSSSKETNKISYEDDWDDDKVTASPTSCKETNNTSDTLEEEKEVLWSNGESSSDDGYEEDSHSEDEEIISNEALLESEKFEAEKIKEREALYRRIAQEIFQFAQTDNLAGQWLLKGGFYPQAVLLFQQAQEKAVKATVMLTNRQYSQNYRNSHNLAFVMSKLPDHLREDPAIKDIGFKMENLGLKHYQNYATLCVRARYQSTMLDFALETSPALNFKEEEASLAETYSKSLLNLLKDLSFWNLIDFSD